MYTLDYIKSLHVDLEVWDSPGSRFGDEDHFELDNYFTDDELKPMMEYDEPDELMDVMSYYMQTSMPRSDISKLVSRQLQNGGKWDIQMQSATGNGDSQTTYSMGDTPLYVMWPDEESVASVSARIKELLAAR